MKAEKKNSVLIVDDEKLNLEFLSNLLSPEYTIYLTKSGTAAIEWVNNYLPDIILLDIVMPDLNGYEILRILKKSPKTQNIPVIFITGLDSAEDEEKGLALNAADFIRKPFHPSSVKLRVRNQIKIVNQIRDIEQYSQNLRTTLTQLEAINNNYKGIIWSVDNTGKITSFSGQYLEKLGFKSDFFIGKNIEIARSKNLYVDIVNNIERTFIDGPQDWMSEVKGRTFHCHTMPMYDESSNVIGVVGSSDDVTLLAELNAAVEVAKEKNLFFAKMSHEMRTPLNAVIGLSNVLLEEEQLNDDGLENIEKIMDAGKSLLYLVNDILDISKMEAGRFELVKGEYDFSNMIGDAINQSIVYKGDKPVEFILKLDENIPSHLLGDDLRIKQILINLLSNAFKYTNKGTVELIVNTEEIKDKKEIMLNLFVKDTGIGIKKENIGKLFSDYLQVDKKTNKKVEGTGLGLSIIKTITNMMSGSISVESEFGSGSTFAVKLPQETIENNNSVIGKDIANNLKDLNNYVKKRYKKSKQPHLVMPYANVLVVDDTMANLDVARAVMKAYKMQIDCVSSGEAAVQAVRDEKVKYNVIFMDHMMPDMDGLEAARIIREEIGTTYAKNVPIIAFTANAISGNKELFLGSGFQAFITKPIDVKSLDAVLREWVKNDELEKIYNEQQKSVDHRTGEDRRSGKDRRSRYDRRLFDDGSIEGVNISKGLERFFGDTDTFLEILQSFVSNSLPLIDSMKIVNNENLHQYAINVHGMKSSCRGICAEDAGNFAETLEKAAKGGNLDFVTANNPAFVETILKLISSVEAFLKKVIVKDADKLKRDKPYKEALLSLRDACDNYQIEEIEAVMKEIEYFEYTADDGLAAWLRENVNQMNYMDVVEKLSHD